MVLTNSQTVLNARYAKKEIQDKVIRADQLITYIKGEINASKNASSSDSEMRQAAEMFLSLHRERTVDYTQKYREKIESEAVPMPEPENLSDSLPKEPVTAAISEPLPSDETLICSKCGSPMIKRVASKGKNVGKVFYGCSKFPICRNIMNIS